MVLEQAATRWGLAWKETPLARQCSATVGSCPVVLALPYAWMNQTGPVVRQLLDSLGLSSTALIVVHDDLDLELGTIRIKARGGAGGHNGVQSIITALHTEEFVRLRIGIGRPPIPRDPADYVLSPFEPEEIPLLDQVLSRSVDALECLLNEGISQAMARFHGRRKAVSCERQDHQDSGSDEAQQQR